MDLTTEKQLTDALPKAEEDGAECGKGSFCLFLSFSSVFLKDGVKFTSNPVQTI